MDSTSRQLEPTATRSLWLRGAATGACVGLGWWVNLLLLSLDAVADGSFAAKTSPDEWLAWFLIPLAMAIALGLILTPLFRRQRVVARVFQGFVLGAACGSFVVPFVYLLPDADHFLRTGHWLYMGSDGWGRGAVFIGLFVVTALGTLSGAVLGGLVWPLVRKARQPFVREPMNRV